MSIVVPSLPIEKFHPLYVRYMDLKTQLLRLAAQMSREGYREAANRIALIADSMPINLPGLPKLKEDDKEICGDGLPAERDGDVLAVLAD